MGPGTNVWSVLFIFLILVMTIVFINPLINMWSAYFKKTKDYFDLKKKVGEQENAYLRSPSWLFPAIATIFLVTVLIVIATLGWNVMQSITTNMSNYENPAEQAEQKHIQNFQLPDKEEIDEKRAELKQRAEVKPHQEALDSFDAKMEQEAKKIHERSLKSESKSAKEDEKK